MHIVIAHSEGVGCGLVVCSHVCTRRSGETIQTVISVGVRHLAAGIAVGGERCVVGYRKNIANRVKRIGVVHNGCASTVDREIAQSATVVISVECLRTVAILQIAALLELVVA